MTMINQNSFDPQIVEQLKKELQVTPDGLVFVTKRGLGRLCGVNYQTWGKRDSHISVQIDQILIAQGFNLTTELAKIPGHFPDTIAAQIIKYYAYAQGKEIALKFDAAISAIGFRSLGQTLLGWQAQPCYASDTPHISRLKERLRHIIADHLWAPFFEAYLVFEYLELTLGFVFTYFCLIDGSMGKHWIAFRVGKPWALPAESYIHNFDDQRGPRTCAAYRYEELPYFKKWLKDVYIPVHMPKYLVEKFGKLAVKEVYTQHNIMNDYVAKLCSGKVTPKQARLYQEWQEKKRFALRASAPFSVNIISA